VLPLVEIRDKRRSAEKSQNKKEGGDKNRTDQQFFRRDNERHHATINGDCEESPARPERSRE
jgi:hypothetical protein